MLHIKRVYDKPSPSDGKRLLVERLWPRGLSKEAARLDAWFRDAAPSTELRKWFSHDPAKWQEFQRRYYAELDANTETWKPLLDVVKAEAATLLFSSHDAEHNNVVALKAYLEARLKKSSRRKK